MVFGPIAPAVASLVSCPSSHAYCRHRRICCFLASRSAGLQQWSSALLRLPLLQWSLGHRPTLAADTGASAVSLLTTQPRTVPCCLLIFGLELAHLGFNVCSS